MFFHTFIATAPCSNAGVDFAQRALLPAWLVPAFRRERTGKHDFAADGAFTLRRATARAARRAAREVGIVDVDGDEAEVARRGFVRDRGVARVEMDVDVDFLDAWRSPRPSRNQSAAATAAIACQRRRPTSAQSGPARDSPA